jgi:transposase InsO family protein
MGAEMARGLVPTGLDQLWVADITYVRLLEKFAYVAVLLIQQAGDRLGLEQASAGEPRHRGSQHGDHGTQACARQPDPSLRSRRACGSPNGLDRALRLDWVLDAGGQTVGWFYFRHNEETARQAKVLTRNEAGS